MSLLKILGLASREADSESADSDVESIRKISSELEALDSDQARYIAAYAYLLGRVAHADLEISSEESDEMVRLVQEKADLPESQAVMVVEIAKRQNRLFGHVENFLVSREFNDLASPEQKRKLLDCLFAVSSSDASISTREDREIRQIASELRLEHSDFIEVRSKYRDYLDVLRKPEDSSE